MRNRTPLNIGLIGASRVATYAVIAPAREIPGVKVVAVAARDETRARRYAEEFSIERVHASYADLLLDPEINLVYLGTPPAKHAEQALAAIAAGKAVLVEKPFALTSAEARKVHDAAAAAGVLVFEAMHSPHHRLFARILEIVRSGEIGAMRSIEASFAVPIPESDPIRWLRELGGGALMDLGVYPLAWARRLAGEEFTVASCDAMFRNGVDASVAARLDFASGVTCDLTTSMIEPTFTARLVVRGDAGTLSVRNPLSPQRGHLLTLSSSSGEHVETVDGPSSYQAQLEAVAASLQGVPFPFPSDDYVRSMEAIEKVRAAMAVAR